MYNVSLKHNLKYFSLEEINNFLKSNWDDLQTQNVSFVIIKLHKPLSKKTAFYKLSNYTLNYCDL